LIYKSICGCVIGAKLPSSAMTPTQQGGWGSCCLRGSEAGAPRWGCNFCFINLLVAASGEASYPIDNDASPARRVGLLQPSRQQSRDSSLGAQFLLYKSACSCIRGAKLPSSATMLPPRGRWGNCCLCGSEAGAPRWRRNFCFINLFVAASWEPSYPRRQQRLPGKEGGATAALAATKPGLLVWGAIFAL
jgi:hypothetical protein